MEPTKPPEAYLEILTLLAFVIPAIFFLLTQYKTLKVVRPENRLMKPGQVWLQLIPLLGQIWQFWVISRIAGSIRKEIEFEEEDSILGSSDLRVVEQLSKRPTLAIGIAYGILYSIGVFINLFSSMGPDSLLDIAAALMMLAGTVCWIIYWVRVAQSRKILVRAAAQADGETRI